MPSFTHHVSMQVPTGPFDGITSLGIDLHIVVDPHAEQLIEACSNTVSEPNNHVELSVSNGMLIVRPVSSATLTRGNLSVRGTGNVVSGGGRASHISVTGDRNVVAGRNVYISGVAVGDIVEVGSGTATQWGAVVVTLRVRQLKTVDVNGASVVRVDGNGIRHINVTGSGSVVATGTSDCIDVNLTGSGNVDLNRLVTVRKATVNLTGSGEIGVRASSVKGDLTGSGTITLYGAPEDQEVQIVTVGSGCVVRKRH